MRTREVLVLAVLLVLFQFADGALTAIGVLKFGTMVEGNFVSRFFMESFGVIPTILAFKFFVVAILSGLVYVAHHHPVARGTLVRMMWFALGVHCIMVWQWVLTLMTVRQAF
jgi:hypothetical protein